MIILTQKLASTGDTTITATLDIDTRIKTRVKITLDNGEDAGIMLPRGIILRDGDRLTDENQTIIVKIVAKAECVSTAYCHDPLLLAKACYHLGNRHVPLQIDHNFARYQHDHVLDDMLKQMGIEVTVEQAPFEPEAGAYHNHSDTQNHGHHH